MTDNVTIPRETGGPMNISEALAWQTVASLLRGEADNADEKTRGWIARACAVLDEKAWKALKAGTHDDEPAWDEYLCHVTTEER